MLSMLLKLVLTLLKRTFRKFAIFPRIARESVLTIHHLGIIDI